MNKFLMSVFAGFMALGMASPGFALSFGDPEESIFYASGSSSPPPSNSHGAPAGNRRGDDENNSRSNTPLGGTPGVELPALVVPMVLEGQQAGYFYLTMALEVRGDDWAVREKVPFIQDALVRYVYANPIPAGLTEEQALDIIGEVVILIAADIMHSDQVIGLIYRDVSTGF